MKTQGTELYFIDPATGDVVKVGCPTSIDGLDATRPQIDTTCLDSNARTYVGGLLEQAAANFTLNFEASDPSHVRLHELYKTNESLNWAIGYSDGTSQPTADSAGEFVTATDRTYIVFNGFISAYSFSFALNAVVTSTLSVQQSGSPDLLPKA